MKKTYQLKSNTIAGEQQVIDVAPAVGKAPVTLMAAPAALYELIDTNLKAAPDNIRVMRKGKQLHIFFDGDTAPGAVIENFYEVHTDNQPKLIGRTDQGALYEYMPESAAPNATVSQLGDTSQSYGMALGGPELTAGAGAVAALLPVVGVSPWLLGAGALGAAAVAGGGEGGGGSATSPTNSGSSYVLNGGKAPGLTIDADTDNNGAINISEKGSATTTSLTATFDKTKVAVGDTVTFSDGTNTKSIALTQTMIDAGKAVSTGWALPADGNSLNVTASIKNAAGNATPEAKDSAKIDTSIPNNNQAPGLTIDADTNSDGVLNANEIKPSTTGLTATFDPKDVLAGDTVVFSDGTTTKAVTLTAADIAAGKVTSNGWPLPTDGSPIHFTAAVKDAAGNTSPAVNKTAAVDTTPPTNHDMGLGLVISTDANNDSWVNTAELDGKVTFTSHVTFNANAVAGDKIVLSATNGGLTLDSVTHTLRPEDITAKFVDVTFAVPANGAVQKVTANYMDAAGNLASDPNLAATDSATLDVTAPSNADVNLSIEINTDTNNNSWVSASELAGANNFVSHVMFNNKAIAGDRIVFTVTNGGSALPSLTHILTQKDITDGFLDMSFDKPAEGGVQKVTVNYVDAAGNAAGAPAPSDSATLDTTAAGVGIASSKSPTDHLNALTFSVNEAGGSYTLHIGTRSFTNIPTAADLTGLGKIPSNEIWMDYVDAAGNPSTREYLALDTSLVTVDQDTAISVLYV